MPRLIVTTDDGDMIWNEGVTAGDFESDHFRRALVDRVGWAVADAESAWHLTTAKPVPIDRARVRHGRAAADRRGARAA